METRAVIEQAKGIIIAQQRCTPEHAFELLTRLSQSSHRKLRDCAADLVASTATFAEDMRRAMETRAVIEQAKGIIIGQQHCTPERAFELLTRLSQSSHRKLRDCAADMVASTASAR